MALPKEQRCDNLRSMTCELSLLSRCDGCAHYHQGDTSVMAAVYGPGEVQIRNQIVDKATVEVVLRPKIGMPGCAEKVQERLIRNTCETVILASLHPRSAIDIIIQILQDSGSLLASSVNAACLALLDSGVPMKYTVAAVTCVIDSNEQVILDPTLDEEQIAVASFTCAFSSNDLSLLTLITKGSFSNEQLQSCLLKCKKASETVFAYYKESLRRQLSKDIESQ